MKIPLPVKIVGGIVLAIALLSMFDSLSGILGLIAIVLWVLGGAVVMQSAGLVSSGMAGSLASMATRLLAPGVRPAAASARATPHAATAAPAPSQTRQVDLVADRKKAVARAESQLRAMVGDDPARTEILEKLIPQARAFAEKKKPLLGAQRGLVFLITGPHGVGKSMVARALADLLYGLEVVQKPVLFEVPPPTGSRLAPDWAATFEEGLDGVTLADNASWLLQTHPLTGGSHADGFFAAVTQVANAHPGRLAVIVTLADKELEGIHQRAGFKDFVRRLTVRHLAMSAMEPVALVKVLQSNFRQHGLRWSDALNEPVRRLIKRSAEDAEHFDNAEAMRRVTESIVESNPATEGREVQMEELERAFEVKV